jgi:hypothetical protein
VSWRWGSPGRRVPQPAAAGRRGEGGGRRGGQGAGFVQTHVEGVGGQAIAPRAVGQGRHADELAVDEAAQLTGRVQRRRLGHIDVRPPLDAAGASGVLSPPPLLKTSASTTAATIARPAPIAMMVRLSWGMKHSRGMEAQ